MATGARHWCANVGHPKGLRTVEFTWVPASFIYTGPQIYNIIGCLCAGQNSLDKIWPPYDLLSAWGIPRRARCTLHMQSFGKPLNFTAVQNKKKRYFLAAVCCRTCTICMSSQVIEQPQADFLNDQQLDEICGGCSSARMKHSLLTRIVKKIEQCTRSNKILGILVCTFSFV